MDTLIAVHALAIRGVMATNNTQEFKKVPGLVAEDWT